MLTVCAPRGRIILLKDYGDKATHSKNFLISAVFLRIIFYNNSKLLIKFFTTYICCFIADVVSIDVAFPFSALPQQLNKKSPQIVGLGPPMCSQIVGRSTLLRNNWIFWCTCHYYDLTAPINSKWRSVCYRLAAIPMSSFEPPIRPGGLGWT